MTCFKQNKVTRNTSGEPPIFLGLMFLHGNSDECTYISFFQHLSMNLRNAPSQPVFGTDDEKAMTNAIDHAFPFANRLACTRHLKENMNRQLQDKYGYSIKDRQTTLSSLFGANGLADAKELDLTFEIRKLRARNIIISNTPLILEYYDNRVKPKLEMNLQTRQKNRSTNNQQSLDKQQHRIS